MHAAVRRQRLLAQVFRALVSPRNAELPTASQHLIIITYLIVGPTHCVTGAARAANAEGAIAAGLISKLDMDQY